jgi:uncharacterized protein YecE (DUF72 family)
MTRKSKTEFRIGTSGYSYSWNKAKPNSFKWYLTQGFNTVEINASFYRYPMQSWVRRWDEFAPEDFDFSIKVHRSITHYLRLKGDRALELWSSFSKKILDDRKLEAKVSFFLFQMPADFNPTSENKSMIESFFSNVNLGDRAVIEFRNKEWWQNVEVCEKAGAVFCSVDAPALPNDIIGTNGAIYLRLHGRDKWYSSIYTEAQLDEICSNLKDSARRSGSKRVYVYLNNDHGMLPNGNYLLQKLGIRQATSLE